MALLERINTMKQQGINEVQIINALKEEGISPMEINEAISQMKIKSAVSAEGNAMQQSIMAQPQENAQGYAPSAYSPAPTQTYQEQYPAQPAPVYAAQSTYQEQYPQTAYPEQAYAQDQQYPAQEQQAYYQQGVDIETSRDIAKQVVEESMQKVKEELASLSKMKSDMKFEMQDIENRIVKIETIIQELQTSIIRRMGQYGESIAGISNEIKATQESFSKMINPILDKKRNMPQKEEEQEPQKIEEARENREENQEITRRNPQNQEQSKRTSSSNGIGVEDYFR